MPFDMVFQSGQIVRNTGHPFRPFIQVSHTCRQGRVDTGRLFDGCGKFRRVRRRQRHQRCRPGEGLRDMDADGPALRAGVRSGDTILAIDRRPIEAWGDVIETMERSTGPRPSGAWAKCGLSSGVSDDTKVSML